MRLVHHFASGMNVLRVVARGATHQEFLGDHLPSAIPSVHLKTGPVGHWYPAYMMLRGSRTAVMWASNHAGRDVFLICILGSVAVLNQLDHQCSTDCPVANLLSARFSGTELEDPLAVGRDWRMRSLSTSPVRILFFSMYSKPFSSWRRL